MSARFDYLPRGRARQTNTCGHCGTSFHPPSGHPRQRFCSRACSGKYIIAHRKLKPGARMKCLVCEKEFRPSWPGRKTCSRACAKQRSPRMKCLVCGTRFRATWYGRKTCGKACARIRGRPRRQKIEPVREPTGMLIPGTAPLCHGEVPHFATDRLGRTTQICRVCGERPVRLVRAPGQALYPQRQDMDDELEAFIERSSARVSHKVAPGAGDAFRQRDHKKGTAEFLGKKAVA